MYNVIIFVGLLFLIIFNLLDVLSTYGVMLNCRDVYELNVMFNKLFKSKRLTKEQKILITFAFTNFYLIFFVLIIYFVFSILAFCAIVGIFIGVKLVAAISNCYVYECCVKCKDKRVETWPKIAHQLYTLLDDIDTGSDIYKPDKTPYYEYVMSRVKEKNRYVTIKDYALTRIPIKEVLNG